MWARSASDADEHGLKPFYECHLVELRGAGRFAAEVAVITVHQEGEAHGMTGTAFTLVPLDPLLVDRGKH